ncbi:NAD(P)-dependent oxidoreductase [Brumimicrobium aurantiacum]|uniref:Phosphoglycerate dehydrogenase n=1 Tax=Brumimicrobium aurantiacum TaxID=1737063 RepID=A0A3E1EY61_9FLAO|nr:NAD(P)-dependent oxidoreductase [Brumimicrobium aurantiacum]RFC54489.1 phosphoglycerate dehydrogenase [Brumimicrobium aurantiacum]
MQVLFIDTVHPILEERLTEKGGACIDGTSWSRDKCIDALPQMDGIVIRSRFPMNEDFLKHGTQLKFIARSGAGMENIDLEYTKQHNIQCFNAPEGNRNAVGEHALGMLLSLFNNLNKGDKEVRQGIWDREENRGIELDGKTVGIIGFGNNGGAFAKKLAGFDVKVLAYDKYKENYGNQYAQAETMEEIYKEADVISFHIPQNEETMFLADDEFFNAFKNPIYVINLARGKIVRTSALLKGINSGKILGACLDVLEYESTSFEKTISGDEHPEFNALLKSDKVLFSPHVGGWTVESYFKLSNVLADKVLDFFKL